MEETVYSKFLGLQTDNHLNWKEHIETMIPKLSGACYAISSMVHIRTINLLNAELNPICYLLALLGAHHFLHISTIQVNTL